jgi:hypothetical protein
MTRTERFSSLDEVRALRLQLKAERDARADDLRVHWENIKDKEFRRGLMLDAASDLLHLNNGAGTLGAIAGGVKMAGGWLPIIGPLLGGRKGILGSRLFWTGLSLVLPLLANKEARSGVGDLWNTIRGAIRQFKDHTRSDKDVVVEDE